MSVGTSLPQLGLAGLASGSQALQSAIKAELLGVDLAAFAPGGKSAEAVVRRDPGADAATLTFVKTGQSLPLPAELAKALIGQSSGSAQIAVEIGGAQAQGTLSATLRRVALGSPQAQNPTTNRPQAGATFSAAGSALALAAEAASLAEPSGWSSLVETLAPDAPVEHKPESAFSTPQSGASSPGSRASSGGLDPQSSTATLRAALSSLASGAGVGFERALARLSTMGPAMAQAEAASLGRFPQAQGAADGSGPWLAQQARAQESSEIQWSGRAWAGAPAWVALGTGEARTEAALETYGRVDTAPGDALAWMRCRVEPEGLGPIDIWAALLGAGRCVCRVRAGKGAQAALAQARADFASALASARVDLAISIEEEPGEGE